MRLDLPFPHKFLWPNGRSRVRAANHREEQKHKQWAWLMALADAPPRFAHNGEMIPIKIVVHPKAKGPAPDRDNCIAASKHYLDGIAKALGVNDRDFAAPTVEFAERDGRFVIEIGGRQ